MPGLRDMTAQLNASRIDQSRQLGSLLDAQNITRAARDEQKQERVSKQDNAPSELACVAGSYPSTLSQTSRTAAALTHGLKQDLGRRAANATGTAAADQKARWEEYIKEFHDPTNDNGYVTAAGTDPDGIENGDIDIEGFLLKDTINMENPREYKASRALLQNLVQPTVQWKTPDAAVNSATGQAWILKNRHLESVRNIASDVVASMIARRAGLPATSSAIFDAPQKNIGELVREIRQKAGVKPCSESGVSASYCIADNPSYNEIMLALTKERFFDPKYFVRLQGTKAAIRQEQASVNVYITLQYQDIYKLQEQINTLLAARASLKLNSD